MGNFLQQLQNNEAILLMYLADELPAEDRAEVEQLLASDAALRKELSQLEETQSAVTMGLRDLDTSSPLPVASTVAMRQVSRIMKQRELDKLIVQPEPVIRRQWNLPWWVYWSASAAAAIVILVVWWGIKPDAAPGPTGNPPDGNDVVLRENQLDPSQMEQARLLDATMLNPEDTTLLAQAENEASLLVSRRGEDEHPLSSVFGTSDQTQ